MDFEEVKTNIVKSWVVYVFFLGMAVVGLVILLSIVFG